MQNVGAPTGDDTGDGIKMLKPRDFEYRHAARAASSRPGVSDERLELTVARAGRGTDEKHGDLDARLCQGFDKPAGRRAEPAVDDGRKFGGQVENAHSECSRPWPGFLQLLRMPQSGGAIRRRALWKRLDFDSAEEHPAGVGLQADEPRRRVGLAASGIAVDEIRLLLAVQQHRETIVLDVNLI